MPEPQTLHALLPEVYEELRRLARRERRRLVAGQTLDTTALVHEAYVKLAGAGSAWEGRSHVMAVAARAMRQILVDYARRRGSLKRGGGQVGQGGQGGSTAVDLAVSPAADQQAGRVVALDLALKDLAGVNERLVQVVECRVFGGLSEEETAQALAVSLRTVQRDWARARAWLKQAVTPGGEA